MQQSLAELQAQYDAPDPTDAADEAKSKERKFPVIEMFGPTIQGEGPLTGTKTMFVRFGGCDYRCVKCDSMHAVLPAAVKRNAERLTAEQIADWILAVAKDTGTPWVTLSGGNPAMWDLTRLVSLLQGGGLGVAVETQGSLWQNWLTRCQMVVISPKGPGMGESFDAESFVAMISQLTEAHKQQQKQFGIAWGSFAVKVVVFDQRDLEFAVDVQRLVRDVSEEVADQMFFLSLGNPMPPVVRADGTTDDDANPLKEEHILELLRAYNRLIDDVVSDPRLVHIKFTPQLHVLAYGNEPGR